MGKLIVERKGNFVGSLLKTKIYLDNKIIGQIENGKTEEFDVPNTIYTIKVGTGTFSGMSNSEDITVRDIHDVHVKLNVMPMKWYILIIMICFLCGIVTVVGLFNIGSPMLVGFAALTIVAFQMIISNNMFRIKVEHVKKEEEE